MVAKAVKLNELIQFLDSITEPIKPGKDSSDIRTDGRTDRVNS
jgi:hypothetical protein